ncbi:MAG: molecular chaperone HtpG [Gammaproteobacteria bacterium]
MSQATEAHSTTEKAEKHGFQAEVKQILQLMIHALYSNKEIFLRELISNASDAADKLRFEALGNPMLTVEDPEFKIWIEVDQAAKTIIIRDNGIGMTKKEAMEHLGTIARSGTKEFLASLTGDKAKDANLIGQFGVGFYSSFIVADKVEVNTRKAGSPETEGVRWTSKGDGEYEIESITKASRGTEIVLHLKPEEEEFLNEWQIRNIIRKYSDHITLPIVMKKEVHTPAEENNKNENEKDTSTEIKYEDEVVNRATALWTLPKSEIKEEQYKELYKHIAHDFEDPLTWSHNKVEGKLEYTSLLYLPGRAPFDLFQSNKPKGLKLYVKRVFILDDAEQFLPNYLRFVRGIIDSNDLPLNVSREILQSNKTIDAMRSAIVKRVLSMLENLATEDKEKYAKFWKEFGQVLKEGPAEDFANREQIGKLLRFASTHQNNANPEVTLQDYIDRMKTGQDKIYYVTADTFQAAQNSPHLEVFRKKGLEVLLLWDRVDEWLMSHMSEFNGKKFQSIAKGKLDLGDLEDSSAQEAVKKQEEGEYADVLKRAKKFLEQDVKDVKLSTRLTESPACVVTEENEMSVHMERLLRSAGHEVPTVKPILELNPDHLMVKRLKAESEDQKFQDWLHVLLDQAILAEGGQLKDPSSFVKRLNQLLMGQVLA